MKKILLPFFMLVCSISLSAQTNLILNGDFEDWGSWGDAPKNWVLNFSAWTNRSTDAQSGDYSVELESSDSGVGYISCDKFRVEAGKTYTCSFYYKIPSGNLTKFEASLRHFDGVFPESVKDVDVTYPVSDWAKCEFTYLADVSRSIDLRVLFWTSDNAKVLIDNAMFIEESSSGIAGSSTSVSEMFDIYSDYIVLNSNQQEVVTIYSVNGCFLSKTVAKNGTHIDISHLSTGVYIISVEGKNNTAKFIRK